MHDYLTYPFRVMRITQRYDGEASHLLHMTGKPRDYPIDEGGTDGGRDDMIAPCDLRITRIWGVGTKGTNSLFCETAAPVRLACGKTDYAAFQITHPNDADLRRLTVGQLVKKGTVLCREGTDGASGNHIHLSVGRGRIDGTGWQKNSRGKWVLVSIGGPLKPEEAFFLDPAFTRVVFDGNLAFRLLPFEAKPSVFRVTAPLLFVRSGPGTQYPKKPFAALSADAQRQILSLAGEKRNGYVRGLQFTAKEIQGSWARTASGWVCLSYCEAFA